MESVTYCVLLPAGSQNVHNLCNILSISANCNFLNLVIGNRGLLQGRSCRWHIEAVLLYCSFNPKFRVLPISHYCGIRCKSLNRSEMSVLWIETLGASLVSMKLVRTTHSNQKQDIIYIPRRKKKRLAFAVLITRLHVVQYVNCRAGIQHCL
jgi:hypothetical protein